MKALARSNSPQFGRLLRDRLDPQRAWVGLQLGERGAAGGVGRHDEQSVEPRPRRRREPVEDGGAEAFVVGGERLAQVALDPLGRRWLQPQRPAAVEERGPQGLRLLGPGHHLGQQPVGDRLLIRDGGLPYAEEGADDRAVLRGRAPVLA